MYLFLFNFFYSAMPPYEYGGNILLKKNIYIINVFNIEDFILLMMLYIYIENSAMLNTGVSRAHLSF